MKDKNVTISLAEYKELLLKERPSDNDKWVLEKIKEFISNQCELGDDCKTITGYDNWHFGEKLISFIKIIDMEFYKDIVKRCYDKKIEEQETKLRVEKMNAIKELNREEQK